MKGHFKTDHFETEGICRYLFLVVHELPKGGDEWRISSEWTRFKRFLPCMKSAGRIGESPVSLGIHRTTVAGYLEGRGDSKPTRAPFGRCPPTGSEGKSDEAHEGCRSLCEPYRESILAKLGQGLSAQRIFQDLTRQSRNQTGSCTVLE